MKKIFLLSVVALLCLQINAQVPQGINYQAVIHNSAGAPVANTTLQVKAGILSDTITPVIVWEELHSAVKTDASGLFSLVIGTGTKQSGSAATFSAVDWSKQLFIKIQVYYQNSWKSLGTAKLWSVPYALKANDLNGTVNKLTVTGETTDMEEALFEVKNKDGQTVFAVYNEGVRIYVDDGAKGAKGGFAIGGFGTTKESSQDLLVVTPDCVRVFIDKKTDKAPKGGFAIGGFGTVKEPGEEYLRVTRDSVRIYLNDTISKAPKGGFAIGGYGTVKGQGSEYMSVNPGNTRFYVRTLADESSSTFNIIGLDQNQAEVPLLMANKDTIEVSGVLNLQNDLIVDGNVSVTGTLSQDSLVKDVEGNAYKTVKIGNQVWMAENLKTTKYNDGSPIPNILDAASWIALTAPAYCWYNNDKETYGATYGALYNFYTVNSASTGGKNVCPVGWHVPDNTEWTELVTYLGGFSLASAKLKETGILHWTSPNAEATNETGFTALPAGWRSGPYWGGNFLEVGNGSFFRSTTEFNASNCYHFLIYYNDVNVYLNPDQKQYGFSIRCLKD